MQAALTTLKKNNTEAGRWYTWLLVVAVLIGVAHTLVYVDCSVEDSYIAFKYVDSWHRGQGFTYNPGEQPVEGYSNFFWLVVIMCARVAGLTEVAAARILGTIIFIVTILLGARLARHLFGPHVAAGVALLLAASFPLSFYSVTGLETGFFTMFLTLALLRFVVRDYRIDPLTTLFFHLVAITRVEGILYIFPCFAYDLYRTRSWRRRHTRALITFVLLGLVFAVWRIVYFESLIPQVFFARFPLNDTSVKMPWLARGFDDMVHFIRGNGGIMGVLLIVCCLGSGEYRRKTMFLMWIIGAGLVFQKFVGGDFMVGARYLVPVLPGYLTILLAAVYLAGQKLSSNGSAAYLSDRIKIPLVVTLAVIWGLFQFSYTVEFLSFPMRYPYFLMHSRTLRAVGTWLKEKNYPEDTILTCWRFGAVGYTSGLIIRDKEGIVTLATGRARFRKSIGLQAEGSEAESGPGATAPDLILEPFSTDIHFEEREVTRYERTYRLVHLFPIAEGVTWRLLEIVPN